MVSLKFDYTYIFTCTLSITADFDIFGFVNTIMLSIILGGLILCGIGLAVYAAMLGVCILIRKAYRMARRTLTGEPAKGSKSHTTERQGGPQRQGGGPRHDYEQVNEDEGRAEGGMMVENQAYGSSA